MKQKANKRLRAHRLGHHAEWLCAAWLRLKGYRVLGLRVRTAGGEIDIVARRREMLVIVEVKARGGVHAERDALESVTAVKRARLARAAEALFASPGEIACGAGALPPNIRFDVMAVRGLHIRHLPDAWRIL